MPQASPRSLVGRNDEIARLRSLITAAERGEGAALVLRGEAGIGKSALLDHVRHSPPPSFQVIRASGSEFEGELPFAALHQLCVPVLKHLEALSRRCRDALEAAFGMAGDAPDPFRTGLAGLDLMSAAAADRPLLCVIDDAHWLDAESLQALTFLARRIAAEPIAMIFAARDGDPVQGLDELPGMTVEGLNDARARELLAEDKAVTLDDRVRERLLAEAGGNPLALIELPKAGGFALPTPSPVAGRIERSFQARMARLPLDARTLLILASADPTGDSSLLWTSVRSFDLDLPSATAAAEASGLMRFDTRVRFTHPLARSAVYLAAQPEQRRAAHRALAEATDPITAPDRRAWHRAQSITGPDEDVAMELESSASRAQSRGGAAAAAAFLTRSAALSLDAHRRTERTIAAAQANLDSGQPDAAAELLAGVDTETLDDDQHSTVDMLRGRIAFVTGSETVSGPEFILRAAHRLADHDPRRSREYFVAALDMGLVVGRAAGVMDQVIDAARSAPSMKDPDLLDALMRLNTKGYGAGVPALRRALTESGGEWNRVPGLAAVLAGELWDADFHSVVTEWLLRTGSDTGSPIMTRLGLSQVSIAATHTGELGRSIAAIAEEEAIADAVGDLPQLYPRVHLAALRGRRQEALDLFDAAMRRGGHLAANVHWATAVLCNGTGDYREAFDAATKAATAGRFFASSVALPELVEAAVRCGEETVAVSALEALTERTEAADTDWARGVASGAKALVTGAEQDHRAAIEQAVDSPMVPNLARARLRYGEWLRRKGRRRDAREQLSTAHEMLSDIGMEAFARRAAIELRAIGEAVRNRAEHVYDRLTMQELHVARQVAAGATSKEVASRLFVSPRTVDAHLRNIFRKLGITSRRQLRDVPGLE